MITAEEKRVLERLQGLKIEDILLEDRDHPQPFRSLELHFDNDMFLEIYASAGVMRLAGFRKRKTKVSGGI